jgi:hypothetical protein
MMNQIVVRYVDGRVVKGITNDFLPAKDRFHLFPDGSAPGARALEILVAELKAVFFVKDLVGTPTHSESNQFDPGKPPVGRKIRVHFKDGEVVVGTTQGYQPGRPGFFLVPADEKSNNNRCFVVAAATREVKLI